MNSGALGNRGPAFFILPGKRQHSGRYIVRWFGVVMTTYVRLTDTRHDGCMTTTTPIYDRVVTDLGFSFESMNLLPITPAEKTASRKLRKDRLRADNTQGGIVK